MRSEQFGSSRTTKFLKPIRSRAWILRVAFLTLLWDGFSKTKSRLQPPSPLRKLYRLTALIELTPQPTSSGVSILKGEFNQFSALYNEKFGTKLTFVEQTTMLARI